MYSDFRGRLQHKGHSVLCKMQRKSCKSHAVVFFLTETSSAENKATVYLIFFTDMPTRTHSWSSSLFYSRYITVNLGLYMCETEIPPLPFKHFKGFPCSAICPSRVRHGGHFYHSMRVFVFLNTAWTEHEINLRGAPYQLVKTLLELMTDVTSEGSGEHVCLHNLVRVSLTIKV